MRLLATIDVHVRGEEVLRRPGFWDKVVAAFGGRPDLKTDRMKALIEATTLVGAARDALGEIGATNAISLVVDQHVVFQDRDGRDNDLGDLFLAFQANAQVFGGTFTLLRLAVEHTEAGLHHVIEIVARGEHPAAEPAVRVVLSARLIDFEPLPGESAETYRARVEPLTREPGRIEVHQRQFDSFVERVRDALGRALPEARIELRDPRTLAERPSVEAQREALPPTDPRYDPYTVYYPSPHEALFRTIMWGSLLGMAYRPDIIIVDHDGQELGHATELPGGSQDTLPAGIRVSDLIGKRPSAEIEDSNDGILGDGNSSDNSGIF